MRYSIEPPCGAGEDVCTLLIGQIPQSGEYQLAQRAKITGQTLDREVAPNHAPLRAEKLEEATRHSAHGPFVARTAEPAESRQLHAGVREFGQCRHTSSPCTQTPVVGGVGQAKVLEHDRHGGNFGGDSGGLPQLIGPNQQIE